MTIPVGLVDELGVRSMESRPNRFERIELAHSNRHAVTPRPPGLASAQKHTAGGRDNNDVAVALRIPDGLREEAVKRGGVHGVDRDRPV